MRVIQATMRSPWRLRIFGLVLLAGILSAGLFHLVVAAPLTEPKSRDRQVTLVVTSLMRREHLSKHALDDEISRRALNEYLKSLDPMKVYFLKSDVQEFERHREEIDDDLKKGDIEFGYTIFKRFLRRVDERVEVVDKLLAEEHDFTVDEEMVIDRDMLDYPKDAAEARERWRKRIKYDLLVLKEDGVTGQEAIDKLTRRYHSFGKRMAQTDSDELLEMYLTAITQSYDPHTTYMSPSSLNNFRIILGLGLEGIGAALQSEDGQTTVTKIIPGGAADQHGKLKVGDQIVSVGEGADGEMVDVVDMKLSDVVSLIRGKADTIVRLGVRSENDKETKIYKIVRAKIDLADSAARAEIIEEGRKDDGAAYKVGVIDLPSFYMDMEGAREGVEDFRSTTRDVHKILDDFNSKKVDVVVLDLRRNGGGSLTEAINLTGLFIDEGPVVQVKDSDDRVQHYDDLEPGMVWKGPLVVLTSKFSASASEIFAGAIQDYRRGIIIGDEATHGKGTVQSLMELGPQLFRIADPPNLGALKITMQQFYRPNGDSTQKRGVLSDVVLPSLTNHMDVGESDLDFAVEFDRVNAAEYAKNNFANDDIIARLQMKSAVRVQKSKEFQELVKDIERYRTQKQRKSVTLNEKKFLAERAELNADKEEEKEIEEQVNPDDKVVERDFYFNEALAITLDYLQDLKLSKVAAK